MYSLFVLIQFPISFECFIAIIYLTNKRSGKSVNILFVLFQMLSGFETFTTFLAFERSFIEMSSQVSLQFTIIFECFNAIIDRTHKPHNRQMNFTFMAIEIINSTKLFITFIRRRRPWYRKKRFIIPMCFSSTCAKN